jgi:hypothetical protein
MEYPRTISIVAVIENKKEQKKANWIWDNHAKHISKHGIRITHICTGNLFDQLEDKKDTANVLDDKLTKSNNLSNWYNQEREEKIKKLETRVHELETQIKNTPSESCQEHEEIMREVMGHE